MSRLLLFGVLLLAGCQNLVGPFQARRPERVDDPLLSISEQERRGRDRLSLPVESRVVGPSTETTQPGAYGRQTP
jgi:hypothetical protein